MPGIYIKLLRNIIITLPPAVAGGNNFKFK